MPAKYLFALLIIYSCVSCGVCTLRLLRQQPNVELAEVKSILLKILHKLDGNTAVEKRAKDAMAPLKPEHAPVTPYTPEHVSSARKEAGANNTGKRAVPAGLIELLEMLKEDVQRLSMRVKDSMTSQKAPPPTPYTRPKYTRGKAEGLGKELRLRGVDASRSASDSLN